MTTARRNHRRHARARHRGAFLHAPTGRPRRARHQGRAARQRRLRPCLRRARARHGIALRLDQSLEGEPDARRQACARPRMFLAKLIEGADVLVQNLAPGAAARLGLSYEALRDKHPRLIVCDISGYGDDPLNKGPYRDKKAYDLLIQSESGFLSITGSADRARQGRMLDSRHCCGHVCLHEHPVGAHPARAHRKGLPHRRLDAGKHGRVDGLPDVLRLRWRDAAATCRCRARNDLSVRPISCGRRQDRDARTSERARMGSLLPLVLQRPNWRRTSVSRRTRSARRKAGTARDHCRDLCSA